MKKKILLVEPDLDNRFKPLGLMRISSYHKAKGDYVEYVKGNKKVNFYPSIIYITSIFSFKYKNLIDSIRFYRKLFPKSRIVIGGILPTTNPKLFEKEKVEIHTGLWKEIEEYPPDYDLFPDIDYSLTRTSTGCPNKCVWCVVPILEGKIDSRDWRKDINPRFQKIVFMDNNWTEKNKEDWIEDIKLLKELVKQGIKNIDFNQSLSCISFTEEKAKLMKGLPIDPLRFSFDHMGQNKYLQRAIKLAYSNGFRDCHIDVLFNSPVDTIEDFYYRIREINKMGCVAIPMCYVPIDSIDKSFVGKNWTKKERDGVTKINPYQFGQISSRNLKDFEYFFGKNAKEFKRLLNYPNITRLQELKMEKLKRQRLERKK